MTDSEELISIDTVFASLRDGDDPVLPCWRTMAELLGRVLPDRSVIPYSSPAEGNRCEIELVAAYSGRRV